VETLLAFIDRTSIQPGLKIGARRRSQIWDAVEIPELGETTVDLVSKLTYEYYNWRTGTQNDITILLGVFATTTLLIALGDCAMKEALSQESQELWTSIYEVMTLSFGDGFPDLTAWGWQQGFSILVACTGLVSFTILLAMVEQLFMEVLERQVRRGSVVYEKGHMLVLGWGESALSLSAIWKILQQMCQAYRYEGGVTVVVLCEKPKLEMEALAEAQVPPGARHGSRFVFRQGSPLNPKHLDMVAARDAGTTIIVSDASRTPREADAQCLRAVSFIDDMFESSAGRGNVVVELKTGHYARLTRYISCGHVIPVPTYNMQSIRLARLVQRPISCLIDYSGLNFGSTAQYHMHAFPELVGQRFQHLKYYFPSATVLGIINLHRRVCRFNPTNAVVKPGDELIFLRRTDRPYAEFRPLPQPVPPQPESTFLQTTTDEAPPHALKAPSRDELMVFLSDFPSIDPGVHGTSDKEPLLSGWDACGPEIETEVGSSFAAAAASSSQEERAAKSNRASNGSSLGLSPQLSQSSLEVIQEKQRSASRSWRGSLRVLIIGWVEDTFMMETIHEMDHGLAALPRGTEVVLFNNRRSASGLSQSASASEIKDLIGPLSRLNLTLIFGDPMNDAELETLPLATFNCITILCDQSWMDPDQNQTNGIDTTCTTDMQRLDSMVMAIQVNVRLLLDKAGASNCKIITEKVAFEGMTRFEDSLKLPLGVSINRKDYIAMLLSYASYTPKIIPLVASMAQTTNFELRDPAMFVQKGELLSCWGLMQRVEAVSAELLLGWVELPPDAKKEMAVILNPEGMEMRSEKRAWAKSNIKLVTISNRTSTSRHHAPAKQRQQARRHELPVYPLVSQREQHSNARVDIHGYQAFSMHQVSGGSAQHEGDKRNGHRRTTRGQPQ